MNVLVAEDEALAMERLVSMIEAYDSSMVLVATLDSVSEVVKFLQSGKPVDLMFLDIQLADGKSFEIFDTLNVDIPIIFTTAFDQYALKAFKLHSIDYLLKPVQRDELVKALDKFKRIRSDATLTTRHIGLLKDLLESRQIQYKQRIVVKAGNKLLFRQPDEIGYFFADGKEVYMVTQNENRSHLIGYSLEELENILDPNKFFRISRKYIVNVEAIQEVKGTMTSTLEVKLRQPSQGIMTVSRDRANDFKKWLDK